MKYWKHLCNLHIYHQSTNSDVLQNPQIAKFRGILKCLSSPPCLWSPWKPGRSKPPSTLCHSSLGISQPCLMTRWISYLLSHYIYIYIIYTLYIYIVIHYINCPFIFHYYPIMVILPWNIFPVIILPQGMPRWYRYTTKPQEMLNNLESAPGLSRASRDLKRPWRKRFGNTRWLSASEDGDVP